MYKIMLVDDEAEVRESILLQIPWEELGFEVVADAENGEDALEKMAIQEPDVIITDIQMPFMTGLEFIEKVREEYPGKEIVIFSGFSEFEYARRAIRLGVKEYILKPVDKEELMGILRKIKSTLDQKLDRLRDIREVQQNYREQEALQKKMFYQEWMQKAKTKKNNTSMPEKCERYIPQAERWVGVFLNIRTQKTLSESAIYLCVEKLFQNIFAEKYHYELFPMVREIGACFALKKEQNLKELLRLLDILVKDGEKLFFFVVTTGVGTEKNEMEKIPLSLYEAREALGYRMIMGRGRTIYIQDVEPEGKNLLLFGSEEESELIRAVKFDSKEEIAEKVARLLGKMDGIRISWRQYQNYLMELYNCLSQLIWQYHMDERRFFGYGEDGHEMLMHMKSREEIQEFFVDFCRKIRICLEEKRAEDSGKIIRTAKAYVEKNYTNPDLSVEMVCEQLNLSQSYFSTVFKKETGENYVAYVRSIRMKEAAELLNRTEDKTYVIAQKVGYTDPYYFSSVFKKTYGVSPSRFRKNGNGK